MKEKQPTLPKTESAEFAALERKIRVSRSFLLAVIAVVMAALPIFQFLSGYVRRSELKTVNRSLCVLEKRVFCLQHKVKTCDVSICNKTPDGKR